MRSECSLFKLSITRHVGAGVDSDDESVAQMGDQVWLVSAPKGSGDFCPISKSLSYPRELRGLGNSNTKGLFMTIVDK